MTYGGEGERVDLNTEGCDVLLLELSGQVTLDEGGLERGDMSAEASHGRAAKLAGAVLDCLRTFPVPPSPTRTSLKVGVSAMLCGVLCCKERLVRGRKRSSIRSVRM